MASAEPTAKAGWVVKTLGEVCIVDWGNTELTKKSYIEEGEFLAVSAAGCDGRINHAEHKKFTPVLSAIGAQCGRMFFPEEDFTAIKNTITLTPIQTETYHKFLFHLLTAVELPKRGAAQPFISKGDIQSFPIPLPPLAEQERIVGILDEAFEGIAAATAQAEKNLHNARELFQSVLQSTFSQKGDDWVETTLGECGSTQTGSTPKKANPEHYGNHIPFIKPGDFNEDGSLNYDNEGLSTSGLSVSRLVQENSALMVCIGATIGKSGWCEREITTNQQINALTPRENLYAKFAYYQFTTSSFQNLVHGSSGQATLPIINKSKWCNLPFVLPPLPTQQAIVEKLDALSEETKALEAIYERKKAALTELKQSLLQKAFAGEL